MPPHHKYIVIDFEYAAPNCRGYDIANHFNEWCADYHHDTRSHSLKDHYGYPTLEQRMDWYRAYLSIEMSAGEQKLGKRAEVAQDRVDKLEREVRLWSPASSAFWSVWGIISAEDMIHKMTEDPEFVPEFDYLVSSAAWPPCLPLASANKVSRDTPWSVLRCSARRLLSSASLCPREKRMTWKSFLTVIVSRSHWLYPLWRS